MRISDRQIRSAIGIVCMAIAVQLCGCGQPGPGSVLTTRQKRFQVMDAEMSRRGFVPADLSPGSGGPATATEEATEYKWYAYSSPPPAVETFVGIGFSDDGRIIEETRTNGGISSSNTDVNRMHALSGRTMSEVDQLYSAWSPADEPLTLPIIVSQGQPDPFSVSPESDLLKQE